MITNFQTAVKDELSQGEVLLALAKTISRQVAIESKDHMTWEDLFLLHDIKGEINHLQALLFAPAPWHCYEDVMRYLASHS